MNLRAFNVALGLVAGVVPLVLIIRDGGLSIFANGPQPGDEHLPTGQGTWIIIGILVFGGPILALLGSWAAWQRPRLAAVLLFLAAVLLLGSFGRTPFGLFMALLAVAASGIAFLRGTRG